QRMQGAGVARTDGSQAEQPDADRVCHGVSFRRPIRAAAVPANGCTRHATEEVAQDPELPGLDVQAIAVQAWGRQGSTLRTLRPRAGTDPGAPGRTRGTEQCCASA